jgi:hypothetical protein
LALLAQSVHEQLFQQFEPVPVCYIGGVFRGDLVRFNFIEEVQRAIGCEAGPPRFDPVAGAVLEAMRLDGNQSRLSNMPQSEK